MRVQKYLASVSQYSRRAVESMMTAKQIKINNKIASLGAQVKEGDVIHCQSEVYLVQLQVEQSLLISYHKPVDIICTKSDPQDRPTVYNQLPKCPSGRWVAVGRLDVNSEGLMLFSNNGDIANKMMHPSTQWQRIYHVRVYGEADTKKVQRLCTGVKLDGVHCQFTECIKISAENKSKNTWYKVTVHTGRYRMVRRMWETIGLRVNRLVRVAYGPFTLNEKSKPGDINWLATNIKAIDKLL